MTQPAGMYGVVRTNGFIGFMIRLITRSRVNHAFVALGDGTIVESESKGAIISPETNYASAIWDTDLYLKLPPGRGDRIAEEARKLVGVPYNFMDIVVLGLVGIGITWKWAAQRVADPSRLICSELVDLAYDRAGVHLFSDGRLPSGVTPGDLEDLIASGPDVSLTIDA